MALLNKFKNFFKNNKISEEEISAGMQGQHKQIIPRDQHNISRSNISPNTLKVLYRLKRAGFAAYLVGGGVRDLLLGREPKDFDVVTDAHPEEVKNLFRNCRLIGRRFRLAHIYFGRELIEVATFRASHKNAQASEASSVDGMIVRDNVFGTMEEDAVRRDFTVNALYYDIRDFSVVDYISGLADLKQGCLRLIGDPIQRYQEDPVRMLRAIRFAAKLGFTVEEKTASAIKDCKHMLTQVPSSRLFDETLKLFLEGTSQQAFNLLRQYGLFAEMFPEADAYLESLDHDQAFTFIQKVFANTDHRLQQNMTVTPAFFLAALLWYPMLQLTEQNQQQGMAYLQAFQEAGDEIIRRQQQRVFISKRFIYGIRDIWFLQLQLPKLTERRVYRVMKQRRFRAGYDFLVLRGEAGEPVTEIAQWWTAFQAAKQDERTAMLAKLPKAKPPATDSTQTSP